jgi:hypothetical protein
VNVTRARTIEQAPPTRRITRDGEARRQVLAIRQVFRRHRIHLAAVALIAEASPVRRMANGQRKEPHDRHGDRRPPR